MDGINTDKTDRNTRKRRSGSLPEKSPEDGSPHSGAKRHDLNPPEGGEGGNKPGFPHTSEPTTGDIMSELMSFKTSMARLTRSADRTELSLEKMSAEITAQSRKVEEVRRESEDTRNLVSNNTREISSLKTAMEDIRIDLASVKCTPNSRSFLELRRMRMDMERQEAMARRVNLLFDGIEEAPGETMSSLAIKMGDLFAMRLGLSDISIDVAHRVGVSIAGKPRRAIVRFSSPSERFKVWEARSRFALPPESRARRLRNDSSSSEIPARIWVYQDRPRGVRDRESMIIRIVKEAQRLRSYGPARYAEGKLWLNDESFEYEELEELPLELRPSYLCTPRDKQKLAFFSKHTGLSNHYMSDFTYEGIHYSSAEQFICRSRAQFSTNARMAKRALTVHDPVVLKGMLRQLGEDGLETEWRRIVKAKLTPGILAKFTQNINLRDELVRTMPLRLGEASTDAFWGISRGLFDKEVLNIRFWTGQNMMGLILEDVRMQLIGDTE